MRSLISGGNSLEGSFSHRARRINASLTRMFVCNSTAAARAITSSEVELSEMMWIGSDLEGRRLKRFRQAGPGAAL